MIKVRREFLIFETEGKNTNYKRLSQMYNFRNKRKKRQMIKVRRKLPIFETEGKKSNYKRPSQIYNFRNRKKKYKL